jgi:hypothetical protein
LFCFFSINLPPRDVSFQFTGDSSNLDIDDATRVIQPQVAEYANNIVGEPTNLNQEFDENQERHKFSAPSPKKRVPNDKDAKTKEKRGTELLKNRERKPEIAEEKETWSDDGRVHCYEESPDSIRCHSHDDMLEDAPRHARPENYNKLDDGVADAVKKSKGNTKTNKISLKKNKVKSRNVPPMPEAKHGSGSTDRNLVEVDYFNGSLGIKDPRTGQRRNIEQLRGNEDIDTDSLMTTNKKKKNEKPFKISQHKTLQELLDHLGDQGYPEPELDFDRAETHDIWDKDELCAG